MDEALSLKVRCERFILEEWGHRCHPRQVRQLMQFVTAERQDALDVQIEFLRFIAVN